jgi:dihydrofolate synthase/folylpolyglutamate synthase
MSIVSASESYDEACRFLVGLKASGVSLGLERMERLMDMMGRPDREVPLIHVAGTNGKGSVSAMLEVILRAAGWRTGMYTSPHLVRLGERIQVNRQALSEGQIVEHVRALAPVVARIQAGKGPSSAPSYFEFMTALAFQHFAQQKCDVAVIEVGLGGRLDATNVIMPEISVITSIGLDHCEMLGDTLEAIAAEKAGIIKTGVPVVIGRMPPAAERVIRVVAAERRARVVSVAEAFGADIDNYPVSRLAGRYQRANAATATLAARILPPRWRISEGGIEKSLQTVEWPARWQRFLISDRIVILDSTHNAEGAAVLSDSFQDLAGEFGRAPVVVTGVLGVARAGPLMDVISRFAAAIHLVRPKQARATPTGQLAAMVPADFQGLVSQDEVEKLFPAEATCSVGVPGDVIVVTGSIYLAGEVLARIDPSRGPFEGELQDF